MIRESSANQPLIRSVRFMNEPTPQPEENPYLASQVADIATSVSDRSQPGPVAIVFSVMTGLAVAVLTFCATFVVTCLGVISVGPVARMPSGFGLAVVFVVAGLTTVAAFVFTVKEFFKVVRSLKR